VYALARAHATASAEAASRGAVVTGTDVAAAARAQVFTGTTGTILLDAFTVGSTFFFSLSSFLSLFLSFVSRGRRRLHAHYQHHPARRFYGGSMLSICFRCCLCFCLCFLSLFLPLFLRRWCSPF
jgi:hypothetical protein